MSFCQTLLNKLSVQPNTTFDIMIDHRFLYRDEKIVRVKYTREFDEQRLSWGTYRSRNKNIVFIEDPSLEKYVLDNVIKTKMFGLDFTADIDETSYTLTIDPRLKTVHILTAAYNVILHTINNRDKRLTLSRTNRTISQEEKASILLSFTDYSFYSYLNVLEQKYLQRIARSNQLTFYTVLDTFVPVIVEHDGLFNPFINNPEISSSFKETELYRLATACSKNTSGIYVKFLTHKQICEALKLKKFVKIPERFLVELIMGFYSNSFPSKNAHMYMRVIADDNLEALITPENYERLSPVDKEAYRIYDTLFIHCARFYRRMGLKSPAEAYDILKEARL